MDLISALVCIKWAFPSTKETLLSWYGSFVEKKQKSSNGSPSFSFWTIWNKRNRIVFDNKEISVQKMKTSFLCGPRKICALLNKPSLLFDFLFGFVMDKGWWVSPIK